MGEGFAASRIREMADTFADYWHSTPGEKGRKCDWFATWRVWARREKERGPHERNGGWKPRNPQLEVEAANAESMREAVRLHRERMANKTMNAEASP
jgi:hypothetical protein